MRKLLLVCSAFMALSACDVGTQLPQQNARAQQAANGAAKAEQAMAGAADNAEQDNIARRLKLTSNPGQMGFVLLLNQAGQPIMYTTVKGKITSGKKRLTNPQQRVRINCGQYCDETLGDAPSDEGTYGESSDYVFFWTADGQYIQWNGGYLYSDKPFRTNVAPLVIKVEAPAA